MKTQSSRRTPRPRAPVDGARLAFGALFTAGMTLGCGESATEATDAGPADAAAARGGADAAPGDDFAVGQPRAGEGGRLRVAIVSATPAPPARNLNDWTIAVSGADGQSLAACTVAVGLFMPAHGHTSTTEPVIRAGDDPSTYQVDDMNLFMPGRWEITFDLVCGEVSDQVLFGVEIAR